MSRLHRKPVSRPAGRPRGLSLVEVLVSMVVVSGMLVAALYTVGAARTGETRIAAGTEGMLLAESLMEEILQLPYEDPDAPGALGRETGESNINRTDFDDIDDYKNWVSEPPVAKDGTAIPWATGYKRMVRIHWLDPNEVELTHKVAWPTGIKRIKVKVSRDGRPEVTLYAVRSEARPQAIRVEEAPR